MAWMPDQQSAQAETAVVEYLKKAYRATAVARSRDVGYDACFTLPYGTHRYVEIKTDFKAQQTECLYFEIMNTRRKVPSGLLVTTADVWAHYVPHMQTIWCFDPRALTWYLRRHCQQPLHTIRLSCPLSGDRNSQGYVVSLSEVASWQWPSVLKGCGISLLY